MKTIILSALALAALSAPAFAQTSVSGSVANSASGVNYAPVSKGGWFNAPGVVGGVASSPYKCKDVLAGGVAVASLAFPVADEECGPVVAAMAWDSCKSMTCRTILSQNRYIRAALVAQQQAGVVEQPASFRSPPRRVKARAHTQRATYRRRR